MADKFEWNQNFSLDIPELDEEHKMLIDIVNELSETIVSKQGKDSLTGILKRLHAYIDIHHIHEEAYMENSNYPQREEHKTDHLQFYGQIEVLDKLHSMDLLEAQNLLKVLCDWIINHICFTDKDFSDFYNKKLKLRSCEITCVP